MGQDTNFAESLHKASQAIGKVHYIIFVTLLLSMVGITLISVTGVLNAPANTELEAKLDAQRAKSDFANNETIPRIEKLESRDSISNPTLPENVRINPFIEER